MTDSDRAFSSFFQYCHRAGAAKCAFYAGSTPSDIYERFMSLLAKLDPKLAGTDNQVYADTLKSGLFQVRTFLFAALYDAVKGFPWVADILVDLEAVLVTGLTNEAFWDWTFRAITSSTIFSNGDVNQRYWSLGVECSDADVQISGGNDTNATVARLEPLIKALNEQSYLGGGIIGSHYIGCAGWQIRSNDVFKGELNQSPFFLRPRCLHEMHVDELTCVCRPIRWENKVSDSLCQQHT